MDDAPAANGGGSNRHASPAWKCSAKQKDFIVNLVEEHQHDRNDIEQLAIDRFGKGVRMLSTLEASGLLNELLERQGGNAGPPANGRRNAYAGKGRLR